MEAESKVFCLSKRLSVEITAGPAGLVVEWTPEMPAKLTAKEIRRYRKARQGMAVLLSEMVGGTVVVVEA